jgi:hypothetical protein
MSVIAHQRAALDTELIRAQHLVARALQSPADECGALLGEAIDALARARRMAAEQTESAVVREMLRDMSRPVGVVPQFFSALLSPLDEHGVVSLRRAGFV